ncbi:type IV secretion system DNA-binding domain-containing protein [Arhodomonas sp. SL1]|uniref:type IV secretory system conjugative DNA transfer family protein n=1 Tax=Arhodomonas sp. SL1 TaxID=3425691 RepID=UPI003F8845AB
MSKGGASDGTTKDPMTEHALLAAIAALVGVTVLLAMLSAIAPEVVANVRGVLLEDQRPSPAGRVSLYAMAGVACVLWALAFWWLERPRVAETTVAGVELSDARALREGEQRGIERTGAGIRLGDVTLSRQREVAHFYLLGLPGSGKTVTIATIVYQVLARGEKLLLHDPKGDYVQWVRPHDPRGQRILYGPWDARSAHWRVGADLDTAARIEDTARDWIADPEGGAGANSYFIQGARAVTAGLMMAARKAHGTAWTFRHLAALLARPPREIAEAAIEGRRDERTGYSALEGQISYDPESPDGLAKSARDVISTVGVELGWVFQVAATEPEHDEQWWSVREFAQADTPDVLILKADSRYQGAMRAIFGAMMRLYHKEVSSSAMPERRPSDPGAWVVIDEFPQLGAEAGKSVRAIQEVGRSKGVRVVIAAQEESQFAAEYGAEAGRVQTSMQQTVILGQLASQTAKEVSDRLGNRSVALRHQGTGVGNRASEESYQHERPVVTPGELTGLSAGPAGAELIAIIQGQPARLTVPYPHLPIDAETAQAVDNPAFEHFVALEAKRDEHQERAEADELADTDGAPEAECDRDDHSVEWRF